MLPIFAGWISFPITAGAATDVDRLIAQPGVVSVRDRINRTGARGLDPLFDTHASTIVQASNGDLLMAYFNGGFEGANNQSIYISRRKPGGGNWGMPILAAGDPTASFKSASGARAMYNPVLFQPTGGPLFLYYKQGTPRTWQGYYKTSNDTGLTWSTPYALPNNFSAYSLNSPYGNVVGPARSKPVQMDDGAILFGSSLEYGRYAAYIQRSTNALNPFAAGNWTTSAAIDPAYTSIQPTFLYHGGKTIQVLTRTSTANIGQSWSYDDGINWTSVTKSKLPNIGSGIEGLALKDGRYILFYNHNANTVSNDGRFLLNTAISSDGVRWHAALELQRSASTSRDQFDYPAAIQTRGGLVEMTYSYKHTGIRNVTLDPAFIKGIPMNTSDRSRWLWPARFYDLVTSPAYVNLMEDNAAINAGYISKRSAAAGNDFGYQTTQKAMGYRPGEIGGVFSMRVSGVSYFGRSLDRFYDRKANLIATGQLWKNSGASGSNAHLYLGFFNSGATRRASFVGLDLRGSTATADIIDNAGTDSAAASGAKYRAIPDATPCQYSILWSPAAGGRPGNLSITIADGSENQFDWKTSGAAIGAAFSGTFAVNAFGLFCAGDDGAGSMEAYIDDNAVGAANGTARP